MTITTYAELQTSVADWLNRSDISATTVRDFIKLGEGKINRVSRLLTQETVTTITMTTAASFSTMPADFLDLIDFYYNSDRVQLTQKSQKKLTEYRTTSTGKPDFYTLSSRIDYERTPDAAYTCSFLYIKKWDLATNTTTTDLLTSHPGAYLYCSLAAAEGFLKNDERIPAWKAQAQEILDELNDLSSRARGKTMLSMPEGMIRPVYSDIRSG